MKKYLIFYFLIGMITNIMCSKEKKQNNIDEKKLRKLIDDNQTFQKGIKLMFRQSHEEKKNLEITPLFLNSNDPHDAFLAPFPLPFELWQLICNHMPEHEKNNLLRTTTNFAQLLFEHNKKYIPQKTLKMFKKSGARVLYHGEEPLENQNDMFYVKNYDKVLINPKISTIVSPSNFLNTEFKKLITGRFHKKFKLFFLKYIHEDSLIINKDSHLYIINNPRFKDDITIKEKDYIEFDTCAHTIITVSSLQKKIVICEKEISRDNFWKLFRLYNNDDLVKIILSQKSLPFKLEDLNTKIAEEISKVIIECSEGNSCLHQFCSRNTIINYEFVCDLIKNGADLNVQNKKDQTPLHILISNFGSKIKCDSEALCENCNATYTLFKLFLKHGADLTIEADEQTPLDVLKNCNYNIYKKYMLEFHGIEEIDLK